MDHCISQLFLSVQKSRGARSKSEKKLQTGMGYPSRGGCHAAALSLEFCPLMTTIPAPLPLRQIYAKLRNFQAVRPICTSVYAYIIFKINRSIEYIFLQLYLPANYAGIICRKNRANNFSLSFIELLTLKYI